MRISWLEPDVIHRTRTALLAVEQPWDAMFRPKFSPPPTPIWTEPGQWRRIAEHVARGERVAEVVREQGLDAALAAFGGADHAVEHAAMVSVAARASRVTLDMLDALLSCTVDDLVAYGEFLALLAAAVTDHPERAVRVYERFCAAFTATDSDLEMWRDRVDSVRDGLAAIYVRGGRHDDGDALFRARHAEQTGDLVVALAAGRSFLAAGATGRAVQWLGLGADRADALGRDEMAARLRDKQAVLRKRQR